MNLPYDYTRCSGSLCSIRDRCARYTAPWRPEGWQLVSDFSLYDPPCDDHYIDNEKGKE